MGIRGREGRTRGRQAPSVMLPFGTRVELDGKLLNQILRHALLGGSAFLIDLALLCLLVEVVGMGVFASNAISFTLSTIYNYFVSTRWVFMVGEGHSRGRDMLVFTALSAIGLAMSQFFMWVFVDLVQIHYVPSKIIATFLVTIYNFISRKVFLEKPMEGTDAAID